MFTEQKRETLITIVGASQSGKTTLAAGLAKTSCDDFNVGFADNATRDYLQPRIAGISAGHWPEATSGEDRDICLNVNTPGGCSALISFKEYIVALVLAFMIIPLVEIGKVIARAVSKKK